MQDDSATVRVDILRDGSDIGAFVQDPVAEIGYHGIGSGEARAWTHCGEDRGGNHVCGADVECVQHDENPETLDRRWCCQPHRSGPHGQAPSRSHPHGLVSISMFIRFVFIFPILRNSTLFPSILDADL